MIKRGDRDWLGDFERWKNSREGIELTTKNKWESNPLESHYLSTFIELEYDKALEIQEQDPKYRKKQDKVFVDLSLCILLHFPIDVQVQNVRDYIRMKYHNWQISLDIQKLIFLTWEEYVPHHLNAMERKEHLSGLSIKKREMSELLRDVKDALQYFTTKTEDEMMDIHTRIVGSRRVRYPIYHLLAFVPLCGSRRWDILDKIAGMHYSDCCDNLMDGFNMMIDLPQLKEPLINALLKWKSNDLVDPLSWGTGMGKQMIDLFIKFERKGINMLKDKRLEYIKEDKRWIDELVSLGGSVD